MSKMMKQIRELIEASGKTRYRIFKETGIDQGQLCKVMQGTTGLSMDAVEKLAECLDFEIVIRPKRKKVK